MIEGIFVAEKNSNKKKWKLKKTKKKRVWEKYAGQQIIKKQPWQNCAVADTVQHCLTLLQKNTVERIRGKRQKRIGVKWTSTMQNTWVQLCKMKGWKCQSEKVQYRAEYSAGERGKACVETWISPPLVPLPAGPDTHCGSLCWSCYTHFLSGQQRGALR